MPFDFNKKLFSGFGYDSSTEDYKVILGCSSVTEIDSSQDMLGVFALKTNSWRTYQDFNCPNLDAGEQGYYVNGALHWIQYGSSSTISFDLAAEKFKERFPLPLILGDNGYFFVGIGTTRNCLFIHTDPVDDTNFSVWIMMEYGVNESWAKGAKISSMRLANQLSVRVNELMVKPLCILEDGGVVLENEGRDMMLYTPKGKTFRDIIEDDDNDNFEAVTYLETLVSPVTGRGASM